MPDLSRPRSSGLSRSNSLMFHFSSLALLASLLIVPPTRANDDIASNAVVDKAGLTVDWFTRSGAVGREKIVDAALNVNENKATTFFIVEAGNYREVISENDLDAFGKPYGIEGALQHIEDRKEVIAAELKAAGKEDVELKLDQYSLPESSIYLLSSEGVVTSIDADTGKTNWTTEIGDSRLPSIGLGVSDQFIAAADVSTVYLLDASTGKLLWSQRCAGPIAASPAVSDERVYVPLTNGRLESFPTGENGRGSFTFVARGQGTARPLVTDLTLSWPTSDGILNVAARYGDKTNAISYRLVSDNTIVSSPTYKDGTIYSTSLDGFVYAIDEQTGNLNWEVSTGEGISLSPVPIRDSVYVVTNDRMLYKLDAKTGFQKWEEPVPHVTRFVGAGRDRVYVTDEFGNLVVISQSTGTILNRISAGRIDYIASNDQTDRLYFGSNTGLVQCLREVQSKVPYFHANEELEAESQAAPIGAEKKAKQDAIKMEDDPFKILGQPETKPKSDPFGEDDDPFKTGGGL